MWPYEVPENWVWVKLDSVAEIATGGTPSKKKDEYYGGEFPFIKPADLDQGRNVLFASEYLSESGKAVARFVPKYSTSVCCIGTIGKCGFLEVDATTNQQINSLIPRFNELFLYYYCCTESFVNHLLSLASATTISIVNKGKMSTIPFPLPPLPEQHRIVTRIESLFTKLDRAKELAQAALDRFETRKAVILHQAFTGVLTAQWREAHGVGLDSWEERDLQSVCLMKITDGTHQTPTYSDQENGVPFISAKDVTTGQISLMKIKYIIPELHKELQKRVAPQRDDVLLAKNGTTGVAAIVDMDLVFDIYVTLAILRPDTNCIIPRFLLRVVNSPVCKMQFDANLTGIGVPNLHLRDIRAVKIPRPTLPEQQEIVRVLDSLLEKEQRARTLCEGVIGQVDLMKKAILARAFRGELGTNDPAEASAAGALGDAE
ncbi:MAG: restriction endonuclease subunit S [Oscillospiraceae bacterium]|nr:restriction endonuclease subunit S [Oscillospiraceae bacterium]